MVIIGGDCGSSAVYMLLRGAKYVIQYEKEERLRKLWQEKVCKDFYICDRAEMIGEWNGKEYPPADIFVIDCEGCECALDFEKLKRYKLAVVAIHKFANCYSDMLQKISELNSRLVYVSEDGLEETYAIAP